MFSKITLLTPLTPLVPPTDEPEDTITAPLLPLAVVPLLNNSDPLTPAVAAFALQITIKPGDMLTPPLVVAPTVNDIEPAAPAVTTPVAIDT